MKHDRIAGSLKMTIVSCDIKDARWFFLEADISNITSFQDMYPILSFQAHNKVQKTIMKKKLFKLVLFEHISNLTL